jgi:hypothetical protein
VRRQDIEVAAGELRKVRHADRLRSFAACCGTPLFFEEAENSPTIDVTIASLDTPERFAPEAAIWTEDRLPWVRIDRNQTSYPQARELA